MAASESVEVHRDWDTLEHLGREWDCLLRESAADCIFLTSTWVRAWADVARGRVSPFVISVRDASGRLIGLAPLYRMRYALQGVLPYRTLRVMGDYPTGGEYADWMLRPDAAETAALRIARTLHATRHEWDCLWMPNVSGWTGARERLRAACVQAGLHWRERPAPFSSFPLPASMDAYTKSLSKNKRSGLKRNQRAILDAGGEIVWCDARERVGEFLDALFALNEQRWQAKATRGTFTRKPAEARFYRAFAPVAFDRGWLRLAGLRAEGRLRAVQIGYAYNGVLYALQEGFDPGYLSGVGNVLRAAIIEASIAEGLKAVDFLGGYNEEKRRWLAEERSGYDLFVGVRRPRTSLLFGVGFWPTGRYLRPHGWWQEPDAR